MRNLSRSLIWWLACGVLALGGSLTAPSRSQAAPNAPTTSATLYPGGSVSFGYLETTWGGTGSSRVLAPQTFLFGNGIPAPDIDLLYWWPPGSDSWRGTGVSGSTVQFIGGALRVHSPASGQATWHTSNNTAACFGGCLGQPTGAFISGLPDLVFQQRLNSGDAIIGTGSIQSVAINQVHITGGNFVALEVLNGPTPQARLRWNGGSTSPVAPCPTWAPAGVAWRLQANSSGSVTGYVRCANAATSDWDSYTGSKSEQTIATSPAVLNPSAGYLVNVNAYGGQSSATRITLNYIKNLNAAPATTYGEYVSPVIDGAFGAQWTSVTCSGVQTYGAAGSIDVYYRVWDGSAPGWSWLGQCNSDGSLSVPGAPRARYFQARFAFNAGSNGYRRLGGATVNYNPDTTPPTCTVSPAPSGAWISGNTAVTVTCTDNEALMQNGFASQNFGHTLNANQGG